MRALAYCQSGAVKKSADAQQHSWYRGDAHVAPCICTASAKRLAALA